MNYKNKYKAHVEFSDSAQRYIEQHIERECSSFLRCISFEICIAHEIEVRGKSENPYIHLAVDYNGDQWNRRIFAKKFRRNYVSMEFTHQIFKAIKSEPLKFQRFCYDSLLCHYFKDKNRWESLYIERP